MVFMQISAPKELRGIRAELLLLRQRWHVILICLALQYCHGIFTQLAHRMHRPAAAPLHDAGFAAIPELPAEWRWLSEALFTSLLVIFILWTFAPLVLPRSFSCVVLWTRLLTVLVVCQSLRIMSFSATQLPGPAPHCRLGTPTAYRQPAAHWWQHLVVDVSRQLGHSCGDLIFSSHMTFVLLGVLSYQHYGGNCVVKLLAWAAGVVLALLIISARKHYTVDVVVAWYTVPLVYCCLNMYWGRKQQGLPVLEANHYSSADGIYSACCSSDSCTHGVCSSCGGGNCSCGCYSPLKKLRIPSRSSSPVKQVQLADVDGSAVITFGSAAMKLPMSVSVRTPTSPSLTSPSWPRLAAVWAMGHRRAGSEGSSSSGSSGGSHDSWGLHTVGSSQKLHDENETAADGINKV